jgi:ABC-type antimicrobial peptide transport system permease subunit
MIETLLVSICGGFVGGLISLFVSFVVLLIVVDKNKKEE